ncbi:MAG: hypothetical protein U0T83_11075 [Bacteriovoracaceae bacterium]
MNTLGHIRNLANKIYPVTIKKTLTHYIESHDDVDTILLINNPIGILLGKNEIVTCFLEFYNEGKKIGEIKKELQPLGSIHIPVSSLNLGIIKNGLVVLNFKLSKSQQKELPQIHFYYFVAYHNKSLNSYAYVHTMDGLQFRIGRPWWWKGKSQLELKASQTKIYSSRLIPLYKLDYIWCSIPNATLLDCNVKIFLSLINEETLNLEFQIEHSLTVKALSACRFDLTSLIPVQFKDKKYGINLAALGAPTENQYPYIFSQHAGGNFAVHHI